MEGTEAEVYAPSEDRYEVDEFEEKRSSEDEENVEGDETTKEDGASTSTGEGSVHSIPHSSG